MTDFVGFPLSPLLEIAGACFQYLLSAPEYCQYHIFYNIKFIFY